MKDSVMVYYFSSNQPEATLLPVYGVDRVPIFYLTLNDTWVKGCHTNMGEVIKSFNRFQNSDVPGWVKIAANLSVDNSFIEEEDREIVAEVLKKTYQYNKSNNGRYCPGLVKLADRILELDNLPGPCLVTNSFNPYTCVGRSVNLEDARNLFPRAINIPSTIKEEQLYLLKHNIIGNLL